MGDKSASTSNPGLASQNDAIAILRAQLKRDEGFRGKPYRDTTGHLTIGYGHNLEEGISEATAEYILSEDILTAVATARSVIGAAFDSASPRRQAALANMAFNLGAVKFGLFRQMIEFVRQGRWDHAASAALSSLWATQVGDRARRIAEALRNGG